MDNLRKRIGKAAAAAKREPTDSALFGATFDRQVFEAIRDAGAAAWVVPVRGLEASEENYPAAWKCWARAGQIPIRSSTSQAGTDTGRCRQSGQGLHREVPAMQGAIAIFLSGEIKKGELAADQLDQSAINACCMSFGFTLRRLFEEHWAT